MSETTYWLSFGLLSLVTLSLVLSLVYLLRMTLQSSREKDKLVQSLANLVSSKDAMTYAALQSNTNAEEVPDVYISKADEDEARQWETLTGVLSDDDDADLRELGLRN